MKKSGCKRYWREWIWWLICPVLCVLLILYTFWGAGAFFGQLTDSELLRTACDACFACGIVHAVLFVISQCLRHGAFETVRNEGNKLMNSLPRRKKKKQKPQPENGAGTEGKLPLWVRNPSVVCLYYAVLFLVAGAILLYLYM